MDGTSLEWIFLGVVDYQRATDLQQRLRDQVRAGQRGDTLLLLEHPPVVTLGRSADAEHVLVSRAELQRRGVSLAQVGRGGDVTYHGPGQLVGYPIRRIGRAIRRHVTAMVDALIEYLAQLDVTGQWSEERPGIWTDSGKIAAVGVDARGGVATHGFALNLSPRLDDFSMIVPCGYRLPVTSVAALKGAAPSVEAAAAEVARRLAKQYDAAPKRIEELSL